MNEQESFDIKKLTSINVVKSPNWLRKFAILICALLIFSTLILLTPWQQSSQGSGHIIAFDPNDRVQNVSSTVPGLISKWFVQDGSIVKKGDPIVEVVDNDPNFLERLAIERDAILSKYQAAKAASETALLNFKRQRSLFNQGLSARTKLEKAKITYKKLLSSEASSAANLAKAEVSLSRQQNQLITAPTDGTILRVLHGSGSVFVKEGDILATFIPKTFSPAAEIFIDGNDLPLIYPGRQVRLQFEGWPAVQFSGWPSVAIGTFGGVVKIIDPSASSNGKFRVLVVPGEGDLWPGSGYLRQGARVYGWVILNQVKLGYEFWRQFNGFPADLDGPPLGLDEIKKSYDKHSKKKKEKKKYKDIYKED